MARTSEVTTNTVISSTWANALITDYLSQTDTTAQAIASNVTVAAGKYIDTPTLKADTVSESTGGAGVTIDGVKLQDSEPYCDVINEKTAATGVTIDGVKLKDSVPYCDVISEKTAATGVTIDSVKLKDGDIELTTGTVERTITGETLGAGATTFAVTGEAMQITGDAGANTIATITGGATGQYLLLFFVDANVTITDTDAHTANTVDLSAAFVSADDTTLLLFFDGTSWYEVSRSVN